MSSIGAFRILEVHLNKPGKAPGGTGRWQAHPQSQRKASWYIGKAVAVSTWFADLEQSVLGINWEAIKGRAEHSQIMQIHRLLCLLCGWLNSWAQLQVPVKDMWVQTNVPDGGHHDFPLTAYAYLQENVSNGAENIDWPFTKNRKIRQVSEI